MNQATDTDIPAMLLRAHRHVWRADAPPLDLDRDALPALLPILLESGSAGLVWPRVRDRGAYGAAEYLLEQGHDRLVAHNRLVEERIGQAAERLGDVGVLPVIIKGWSLSRRYPRGIVRSAGDIDLVVPADDYELALATLVTWANETGEIGIELHRGDARMDLPRGGAGGTGGRVDIDLHRDTHWDSRPAADALARAERVVLGNGREVGVLCPEDNLRQLSFHYLWHGATRLLRLVDIALLLESRPDGFDWDRVLGDDAIRRNWVVTALGLAHRLLDARIEDTPVAAEALRLPAWLLPVAEQQVQLNQPPLGVALAELKTNPRDLGAVLKRRWPDPITATTHLPAAFTGVPRLPIQWAVYLRQMAEYTFWRLPGQAARQARVG